LLYDSNKNFALWLDNVYQPCVAETKPTPVRIDEATVERLKQAAKTMGNTRAGIIKLCVSSFLDYFEANGGTASLPINWRDAMAGLDGRTRLAALREEAPQYGAKITANPAVNSDPAAAKAKALMNIAEELSQPAPGSGPKQKAALPSARKRVPRRGGGKGT
jgi:hypothetical protein